MKQFTDVPTNQKEDRMRLVAHRATKDMKEHMDSYEEMFIACCLIASTCMHYPGMQITDGMDRAIKVLMEPIELVKHVDIPDDKSKH